MTVVVNVGIRLAGRGLRTLLIDMLTRSARLWRPYSKPISKAWIRARRHLCAESGSVGSGRDCPAGVAVDTATQETAGDYDRVILYAPNLMQHEPRAHRRCGNERLSLHARAATVTLRRFSNRPAARRLKRDTLCVEMGGAYPSMVNAPICCWMRDNVFSKREN